MNIEQLQNPDGKKLAKSFPSSQFLVHKLSSTSNGSKLCEADESRQALTIKLQVASHPEPNSQRVQDQQSLYNEGTRSERPNNIKL
ncbi:unnamed protein product [Prunus armeniaca]|uniref:Uncharacterized protein n=1 Tax=Prunus armeniaca TaxID=36596 RepID=A0A6J5W9P6_PRUAR|nr:unnamed protein product [Prunus armeniaca]